MRCVDAGSTWSGSRRWPSERFPPLVYLFCRETRQSGNDLSARFFFDANGVREDPATGNGAAFPGAYLLECGSTPELSIRIEQGHEGAGLRSCGCAREVSEAVER